MKNPTITTNIVIFGQAGQHAINSVIFGWEDLHVTTGVVPVLCIFVYVPSAASC